MSQVVDYALNRLVALLPLAKRQSTLSPKLRKLHQTFLRCLAEEGRMLTDTEVVEAAPGYDRVTAVWTLASLDLIVLDPTGRPVGAYPLTTEETPHQVIVNGRILWTMCALDALAVAPLFDTDVSITSRCPVTGERIAIEMSGQRILQEAPERGLQLVVWWRDPAACAARNFCPGVMFVRDRTAATQWQGGRTTDHDFASLHEAVEVAVRFFRPLMLDLPVEISA